MFEQRLRELRLRRDMSQADLAKALGVSAGTIGNYESGIRHPKSDFFQKLAEYFGVSEAWLRRGTLINDKQREAIIRRFEAPLELVGADAETIGVDPNEVWQALNSKATLREDRIREIAEAIGTRVDDILADPDLQTENTLEEDVTQMLQDLYDKDSGLMAELSGMTPEELAEMRDFAAFVKSKR